MTKKTLNLSIDERMKERAKRIAQEKGISVSRFFEELIASHEDPDVYTPAPGSAAETIYNLIQETQKTDHYDYIKSKEKIIKKKNPYRKSADRYEYLPGCDP